jgi:hypothetical protein
MNRGTRIALRILYWVAVVLISLALLVGLILLFESRDESDIEDGASGGGWAARSAPAAPAERR